MRPIVQELDDKLNKLDAKAASSLENLVRNALELVDTPNGTAGLERLPADFFSKISHEFGPEPLERPPQGDFEKRVRSRVSGS
jgi:hypothetical protein